MLNLKLSSKEEKVKEKERFYKFFGEIHDILEAQQILEWDQQVIMPKGSSEQRAGVISTLAEIAHKKLTSEEAEEIISNFESKAETNWEKAHSREARKMYQKQKKIPSSLIAERSKQAIITQSIWKKTKPASDYKTFLPYLKKVVDITREIAKCGDGDQPYDFLLDEYEPFMTIKELDPLFENLKKGLKEFVKKYSSTDIEQRKKAVSKFVSIQNQEKICRFFLNEMGFDFERGRMDISAHPFTTGTMDDVRMTTRYKEYYLPAALFGALHEGGHSLYEQGLDRENFKFPAGQSCSLGLHESQSRFWENIIGRSRGFWERYYEEVNNLSDKAFNEVSLDEFYKGINCVAPSFIRVEADEVTYNLHIILRYEIEKELINENLNIEDLPLVWNDKFFDFFGIKPPTFAEGFMQDIHWSIGLIGYFPTYALGNLYSGMIKETLEKELSPIYELIKNGKLKEIRNYLKEKIHLKARLYSPKELLVRVTSRDMSEVPFLNYLKNKYNFLI